MNEQDLLRYIDSCNGLLSQTHVEYVRQCWDMLSKLGEGRLMLPMTEPTTDNKSFQFCWRLPGFYLEIDIKANGKASWFGSDRDILVTQDGEFTIGEDVGELISWLKELLA